MWHSKLLTQITQTSKNLIAILIFIIAILLIAPYAMASTYVPLDDNTFDILNRLEAEGVIQSGLLTTRPLSRNEMIRLTLEAERNSKSKSLFIQQLIKSLKNRFKDEIARIKYIKPIDGLYGKYVYFDSKNSEELVYNNDGDNYEKGFNFRFGLSSMVEFGWFSFYINPEIRYSDDDTDLTMKRAYSVLSFLGLELELGKDSQWWGPGYHGAILVSNNPEPLTMLKLTNSQPVILPFVFKYLGLFKFTIFTTRLEKDREIPNPYLWGMRINLKPNSYLELGLQRTALLGGKGRSEDFEIWLKSFTGKGENEPDSEAGDQRAGLDLKLTLPFNWQPLQLYTELAGEDEAGGLPSKWAYLAGIYLPGIFNLERLDFRAEYATTHIKGHPDIWYSHGIYKSGYTYKGRVIGHHMGTDSRDIFLEARYYLPKINNGRITISYDMGKHNLSGNIKETTGEFSIEINLPVKKLMTINTVYSYGRIKNLDNVQGINKNINILMAEIMYRF